MKRLHSVDILRALAILLMVQVHFVNNLGLWADRDTFLYALANWLGILPAPLFTFLVGVSLFISLSKYPPERGRKQTLRRGAAIFVLGLLHNLVNWGAEAVFDWDILTLIASAILLVYFLRRVDSAGMIEIIFVVILISPPLRAFFGYNEHWDFVNSEYLYSLTAKDLFLGWFLQGTFPLFPWIVFPLAGYASGRAILSKENAARSISRARFLLFGGLVLVFLGAAGAWMNENLFLSTRSAEYLSPILFYPASTTYLVMFLGLALAGFAGLWLALDSPLAAARRTSWEQTRLSAFMQRYSRYSLSVYLLHHSMHLLPLYFFGWLWHGDKWWYYTDAIPVWAAWVLWGIFIAAFYLVLLAWDEIGGRYSFEWMLGRIVKGKPKNYQSA
jgi:uncharacterized membrane protein